MLRKPTPPMGMVATMADRDQVNFELYDDGSTPGWLDRPPGQPTPALRPDQMQLPIPALDDTFVIPCSSSDALPAGWTFLAAELEVPRLTRLNGRFLFRRDADTRVVAVWMQWSPDWNRLPAIAGEPDTGEPLKKDLDSDMRRIEETVLRRTERYLDLLTLVGGGSDNPGRATRDAGTHRHRTQPTTDMTLRPHPLNAHSRPRTNVSTITHHDDPTDCTIWLRILDGAKDAAGRPAAGTKDPAQRPEREEEETP